jgi:site-specific recombinase XerD
MSLEVCGRCSQAGASSLNSRCAARTCVRRPADSERRALFAVLYGTGIEVGTALRLTRADVWDASREIRAAGTKTHTRDRVAVVADWAWPIIADYVRRILPTAPLFPAKWKC